MVQNIRRDELISIHILRVEDDKGAAVKIARFVKFQSTSSVWRMTKPGDWVEKDVVDFNPHPPCGG